MCKTIGFEAAVSGINSLFILSEEKSSVYKHTLNNAFTQVANERADVYLKRIYFDSMLEWDSHEKNTSFFFQHLENLINDLHLDLIIFDNFTTSFFGQLSVQAQGDIIEKFRILASEYDIAIVGVFHTIKGTDIYKTVISGEDVRGNSTSTNAGSYNYILTTYFRANPVRAFLFVDKARYHPRVNKTYWELVYDKDLELYVKAGKSSYESIKSVLHEANTKVKESFKKKYGEF